MSVAKRCLDLVRAIAGTRRTDANAHHHTAVILAAGVGSRMGSATTKQMRLLAGKPIIVHTLLAFDQSPYIHEIVLVAKKEELDLYPNLIAEYGIRKVTKLVVGGQSRQESSAIGVRAVSKQTEYVSIHDGARCLVTAAMIEAVVRNAYRTRSVSAAACPAVDTVKKADANGIVQQTPKREQMWLVQTPQTFSVAQYCAAEWHTRQNAILVTDDCSMAEAVGFTVQLVDCGTENRKITTQEDIPLALAILHSRGIFEATEDTQQ